MTDLVAVRARIVKELLSLRFGPVVNNTLRRTDADGLMLSGDAAEVIADALFAEITRVEGETWCTISTESPRPHARYEVRRDDVGVFAATPCYGLHEPWWVPLTADVFAPGAVIIPMMRQDHWRPWQKARARGGE